MSGVSVGSGHEYAILVVLSNHICGVVLCVLDDISGLLANILD